MHRVKEFTLFYWWDCCLKLKWGAMSPCHFFIVEITMLLLFWRKQLHSESSDDLSKCCHYCWVSAITHWFRRCFFAGKHSTTYQLVGPILFLVTPSASWLPMSSAREGMPDGQVSRKLSPGQQQLLYHSNVGTAGDALWLPAHFRANLETSLRI